MLLSRIWYLLLAVAAALAASMMMMATSAFNREVEGNLADQLRRDRYELELVMRSDARTRIDTIAGLAAHGDITRVLGQEEVSDEAREALQRKLQELNSQLRGFAGDLVFAVNREGTIVAALGVELPSNVEGSGIGAFPLVDRALNGFVRDDVWVWNDRVYRMAARPVVFQGNYVGAIVHGMEVDSDFAQLLSRQLGDVSLAFFHDDRLIGSHIPATGDAVRAEDLAGPLAEVVGRAEVQDGNRSEPVAVQTSRAVYSLMTGSAAGANVGYVIARPYQGLAGIGDLFGQMDFDKDLGLTGVALLGGGALLAFLLAMLFVWLEHDRPMGGFQTASQALGEGKSDRFDLSKFGGKIRKVAEHINMAIERAREAGGAASSRKPADLDDILGPSPAGGAQGPSFFGFAEGQGGADIPDVPPGPDHRPMAPIASTAPLIPALEPPAASGARPGPPPAPPGPPPAPPPPSGARPGAGAAPPPPPGKPAWATGSALGAGTEGGAPSLSGDGFESMAPPPQPASEPAAGPSLDSLPGLSSPGLSSDTEDEEGATMVASVPQELLDQVSGSQNEEEAHFHEVFQQFVRTKEQCGENTSTLTFDRFKQTLRKNRDTILSKHSAKGVRFTVYVKAGKAALKATPIK